MKPKRILTYILPFYIAIGPVYWFLFLSPSVFNAAKYALALLAIGSAFFFGASEWLRDRQFISGSSIKLVIGMVFISLPAMYVSQSEEALLTLFRYGILFGLLIALYWLAKEEGFLRRTPPAIALVMIPLCLLTVADFLLNLGLRSFDGMNRLYATGFSTSRTQWSGGLVCLSIFMMWCYLNSTGKIKTLYLTAFVIVLLSQLSSGGRGGTLASLLGVAALLVYYRRFGMILAGIAGATVFAIAFRDLLFTHLRFDRLQSGSQASSDFSSGRLDQYGIAFDLIRSPMDLLIGLGPKGYDTAFAQQGIEFEIHNVWLRLLIEYGIFMPVFVLGFLVYSMRKAIIQNKGNKEAFGLVIILLAGMFTTLVEPNAIVFSFQNYLLWWLIFIALKRNTAKGFIR